MKMTTFGKLLLDYGASADVRSLPGKEGSVGWSCPSNIAIIKYWGKRAGQLPMNPNLSMTLSEARTRTTIHYRFDRAIPSPVIRFFFEGVENPGFMERVGRYIHSVIRFLPLLAHTSMEIRSENSFPHSSGIASSASAMGALALCLTEMEAGIRGSSLSTDTIKRTSFLARLGSGSACRSVHPGFALWGRSPHWEGTSDEYAIEVTGYHDSFRQLRDAILIVETAPKKVSSSAGHALMESNPFSEVRYRQAGKNLGILGTILSTGDWEGFINMLEEEALTLHALMMAGKPGVLLMRPATIAILHRIRDYRKETGQKIGFSLDAGANVHVLYSDPDASQVEQFIRSELTAYCENGQVLFDRMGNGPERG